MPETATLPVPASGESGYQPRWFAEKEPAVFHASGLAAAASRIRETAHIVRRGNSSSLGVGFAGQIANTASEDGFELAGILPPLYPEWLGDPSFLRSHKVRFPYVTGEMATGIATAAMVVAASKAGFLAFFGAAGLGPEQIDAGVAEIERSCDGAGSWGSNLIHSPQIPGAEDAIVDVYLRRGVTKVSASAFMAIAPSIVRYAATGLRLLPSGKIERRNSVFAKVSRAEVATQFMAPAPVSVIDKLVQAGKITAEEARLAAQVPVAEDITAEADSGGHTDNRPLTSLMQSIRCERDRIVRKYGYERPIRVGAAGGLGTPAAIAAAFAMGAAYVMTGSVNQAAVEAGTSDSVKKLLAAAGVADCAMAAAGDMFEMGVKVQVLKKGTLFAARANRLYQIWKEYAGLEDIPAKVAAGVEKEILRASFSDIWHECRDYWQALDSGQIDIAEREPKHKMALIFRWYLGNTSKWALDGTAGRESDYQIWCGPAMGAFNLWAADSFLARLTTRTVGQIGRNLMEGAAVVTRAQQMRSIGVAVPASAFDFRPRPLA